MTDREMVEPRYPATAYSNGENDPVPRHCCNPRRAYDRDGYEVMPMDPANAAQNGARFIRAICPPPCRHEGDVALERFPKTMAVRDVGLHLRCTACGWKGPETEPVWPPR